MFGCLFLNHTFKSNIILTLKIPFWESLTYYVTFRPQKIHGSSGILKENRNLMA